MRNIEKLKKTKANYNSNTHFFFFWEKAGKMNKKKDRIYIII